MNTEARQNQLRNILKVGKIIDSGVDGLTVTTTDKAAQINLLHIFNRGSAQAEAMGDHRKKQGFQGFMGHQVGPWFYGRREDLWLMRVMGGVAHDVFHDLPWPALNCTRIDVQLTLQLPEYNQAVARLAGNLRDSAAADRGGKPRPTQDLKGVYAEGQTLYIGSRESPKFGRVYNKQEESKDERYERAWRFEVEVKKMVAPLVVQWLLQEQNLRMAAIQTVVGQYEEWGVPLALGVEGKLIGGSIGRRDYDSERAMKWLRTQVAPTVERLLGSTDVQSILEALGLYDTPASDLPPIAREWAAEIAPKRQEPQATSLAAQDARKWW